MIRKVLPAVGLAVALAGSAVAAPQDQPLPLGSPRPSEATIQAWKDRKFGLFIHFGLYSVAGGMWKGRPIDNGYSEQILANGNLPAKDYAALAWQFDPKKFDPDAIAALAKAAGMRFIVITAKHHDGFNLFETGQTTYNAVDGTPYGKDIVRQMAEACARHGLAFGVYYSTIDWHHPGGNPYLPGNSNPITAGQEAFNVAQIKELLGHYGPISEIWFDMGKPTPRQSAHFAQTVHALQPQTMVSGRVWNHQGDFTVMGDNEEPGVVIEEPWQSPASIFPETWGYRSWQARGDLKGKTEEHIARLVRVVSHGGNYILNIGPEGDGSVVPFEADILKGMGEWMKVSGEAIYATQAQPFDTLDFGYATVGKGTLYLFVEKRPADGILRLPHLTDTRLVSATLLGGNAGALPVAADAEGGRVDISNLGATGFMPVVAVKFNGDLHVRPDAVAAGKDGRTILTEKQAAHFLNYNGYGYAAPETVYKLRWYAAAGGGRYRIDIRYRPTARPRKADLTVDGRRMTLILPPGGHATATVARDRTAEPYAMRVELTPVEPFHKGDALPVVVKQVELSKISR